MCMNLMLVGSHSVHIRLKQARLLEILITASYCDFQKQSYSVVVKQARFLKLCWCLSTLVVIAKSVSFTKLKDLSDSVLFFPQM